MAVDQNSNGILRPKAQVVDFKVFSALKGEDTTPREHLDIRKTVSNSIAANA